MRVCRFVALPLVVLAACSEPEARDAAAVDSMAMPAGSAAAKACDVIPLEHLEEIVAIELKPGRITNDYGGVSQCQYDRDAGTPDGVSISLHERGNITNYSGIPGSVAVSGIGDEAVWNEELNQLAVRKGEAVLSISLFFPPPRRDLAERIAVIAVENVGT